MTPFIQEGTPLRVIKAGGASNAMNILRIHSVVFAVMEPLNFPKLVPKLREIIGS